MASANIVTTSYLLGNLHCPSCVALIRSLLHDTYGDDVLWVSPNLVTSVVTVEHRDGSVASVRGMEKTLQDVGFDIYGVHSTADATDLERGSQVELGESSRDMHQSSRHFNSWFRSIWSKQSPSIMESAKAAHIENCQECQSEAARGDSHGQEVDKDQLTQVSTVASNYSEAKDPSYTLQQVITEPELPSSSWRVTLSVGGMTCAVCVNTISNELKKNPWISQVAINLVMNSATVDYADESRTQDIVDAIEDLGYDVVIDQVVNLEEQPTSVEGRDIEIQVDGIFCPRCPERISMTLKSLGPNRVEVLREPSLNNSILKLHYTPEAPNFTIRHILRAIEAADTSLRTSIYHAPTLEERSRVIREKHQRSLLVRQILTIVVAVPTFVLGIVYMSLIPDSNHGKMYLMEPWASGLSRLDIALFILATPVYFFAANVFHVRAIKELRTMWRSGSRIPVMQRFWRFGSMNMLISLGTSIAYFSSVAQMIVAAASSRKHHGSGAEFYFDSVVFLTLFLLAGRLIEGYSKSKTGDAVELLGKLRPTTALLLEKDKAGALVTTTVPVDQLDSGDVIRVPHGASPPADGVVVTGETTFDESSLTGESRQIKKAEGDQVFAGTINKASAITVRVTGTSGQSMLDQIVQVVREGHTKRAPIEQIADVLTTYFVPVITLVAIITWVVWMALGYSNLIADHEGDSAGGWVAFAFQFAIAVFVVACPCGLALAAPTAIFVGGGIAAKHGILAKGGGEAFEKASKIDCVVFDKTGTLTQGGEPQITDAAVFPDVEQANEDERRTLMSVLKAVEENSSHPIAKAVVAFCGADTRAAKVGQLEEFPGKGMKATYTDKAGKTCEILVGNELLMRDASVTLSAYVSSLLECWKSEAKSIALVATKSAGRDSWTLAAALSISDPIRSEASAVIDALTARKTQVWMLSGDNATTARAVAQLVGIPADKVLAEVLPSDKAAQIARLQASLQAPGSASRRATVAMVGDGINDAPALATADVGIAVGSGSDVAIGSAAFVLTTSRLAAVVTLLDLSQVVFRRIRINFAWAVVYNLAAVPIAAGCLYPVTTASGSHVRLDPVWAALAMALSSISVVLSSLSLRTSVPGVGFRYKEIAEK
ncbi:E1-E2 ATPase-domain-containing protein [Dactylonectria estremocensis]|uniref:E1-E2 ATPase-domain-containing protein n=1 Tax=Dactylonectria estremocensis TaxID=1079267 RepID=A0A9P9FDA7_9HYPO|nr:E1-E2 ATPase-domain-containing protein [Dactylonectria estremocensis]